MPTAAIIAISIAALIFLAAAAATILAPRLEPLARVLAIVPLAAVAAFSLFGLFASREPGTPRFWTALYLSLLVACTVAIIRLTFARRPAR